MRFLGGIIAKLKRSSTGSAHSTTSHSNGSESNLLDVVTNQLTSLAPAQRHQLLEAMSSAPSLKHLLANPKDAASATQQQAAYAVLHASCSSSDRQLLKSLTAEVLKGVHCSPPGTPLPLDLVNGPLASADSPASTASSHAPAVPQGNHGAGGGEGEGITVEVTPEFDEYPAVPLEDAPDGLVMRAVLSLQAQQQVQASRSRVALVSVLDVSGSMFGQSIALLQATSNFLVDQVNGTDYLSFVTYSTDSHVAVPMMRMTPAAKAWAKNVISALRADGSTALCSGTLTGMQQLREPLPGDAGLSKAVLLCTDGQATDGPTTADAILPLLREEERRMARPCTLHCFGIGEGHSAPLLQGISEAMSGSYYYISQPSDIPQAYGDALGGMMSAAAHTVRVQLQLEPGVVLEGLDAGGVISLGPTPPLTPCRTSSGQTAVVSAQQSTATARAGASSGVAQDSADTELGVQMAPGTAPSNGAGSHGKQMKKATAACVTFNELYGGEIKDLLLRLQLSAGQAQEQVTAGAGTSTAEPSTESAGAAGLDAGPGSVVAVLGASPVAQTRTVGSVVLTYTHLSSGQTRRQQYPLTVSMTAKNTKGSTPHPKVVASAARYDTVRGLEAAEKLAAEGQHQEANAVLQKLTEGLEREAKEQSLPSNVQQELRMLTAQTVAVSSLMSTSKQSKEAEVMTLAAGLCLKHQRAPAAGVTASLPGAAAYDSAPKMKMRAAAMASVTRQAIQVSMPDASLAI